MGWRKEVDVSPCSLDRASPQDSTPPPWMHPVQHTRRLRQRSKACFDPASRHTRYEAEFQSRWKKASEGWADSTEDLKLSRTRPTPPCSPKLVSGWQSTPTSSGCCSSKWTSALDRSVRRPWTMPWPRCWRWSHTCLLLPTPD